MKEQQNTQQPVAWLSIDRIGERYLCFSEPSDNDEKLALYTAPPAPRDVLMAAMREVQEQSAVFAKQYVVSEPFIRHCINLGKIADRYASQMQPEPVAQQADWKNFNDGYKAGAEEMRDGLLQLCKDFSDRQNRPYMGDVLAQVNSLCDLVLSEIPRSLEQQAEHNLTDIRCECCGYLTHQREHMGCIRAAHSPAVDVPDVLEQLQLAETDVTNAKAWSAGEEAKTHCRHALTAIAVVRSLLSAAQKH